MPKPLVVFDCVVFVQSLIKDSGPAARCLERFEQGRFSLAVSPQTLTELRDVLSRSSLRQDFPAITEEKVGRLMEVLLLKAMLFQRVPKRFAYPRDPDDEPYVNLAIEAGAQFLVTRDRDLLDLMRADTEEGRGFQRRFQELKILDPVAFLEKIGQTSDEVVRE